MELIQTDRAPEAIGPYSQAVVSGDFCYTSGQIPLSVEGVLINGGIEEQTSQVLKNLQAVLQAAGADLDTVVKTTIFLTDLNDFNVVNEIYGKYFRAHRPARSCVQVSSLPKGAKIEIEAVALVKKK